MTAIFQVDEGKTYEYVVHGSVVVLIGILLIAVHWSLTVLFLLVGIGLITIKTGVEINFESKSIRKYKNRLGYKVGKWYDLANYQAAELHYNSQQLANSMTYWPSYISRKPGSTNTYDLVLIDQAGKAQLFNPFLKFSTGNATLEALKKIPDLEIRNYAAAWIESRKK